MASLEDVDLTLKLGREDGEERLDGAQMRLLELRLRAGGQIGSGELGPPLCVVFEGWDASGKGGAIRRLTAKLDPRHVRVAQFAAPTPDELRHHYLWRFWPALPGRGGMTILDRSWYGRVLVERVERLTEKEHWERAYREIVDFERSLCDSGMVLVKLWLHLSEDEQRRRLLARQEDPFKRWKLTDEDWRNLARRAEYEVAVAEMLRRTSHERSPWHPISAESKRYARVAVVDAVAGALERALDG